MEAPVTVKDAASLLNPLQTLGHSGNDESAARPLAVSTTTALKFDNMDAIDMTTGAQPETDGKDKTISDITNSTSFDNNKQPSLLNEECPICCLILPWLATGRRYMECCGKIICSGCCHAPLYDNWGKVILEKKCPFCRNTAPKSDEENMERHEKRAQVNDATAIRNLGCFSANQNPRDYKRALEFFHRAAKLGNIEAYCDIGNAYFDGEGVEKDQREATRYYKIAAIRGDVEARYYLAADDEVAGRTHRALEHHMIAVRGGNDKSLKEIEDFVAKGHAKKEDYEQASRAYEAYLEKVKNVSRDNAAANSNKYRYY